MNEHLDGINDCEICGEPLADNAYRWSVSVSNGAHGGFFSRKACRKCVKRITKSPMDRIRFFEILTQYMIKNKLSKYEREHWDYEHIEALKEILLKEKVPLINYGIALYTLYNSFKKIYLHEL